MSELDPENNGQKSGVGEKIVDTASNKTQEALKKEAKKRVEKRLKKESIKSASKMSLAGPLATVLFWVFVVIVAIIIITGIVMFLVTMPGMVMEKLKAIFKEIGNYIAAFYGADTTQQIDDVQIYETLDYLEDMGWDLKAEGFLTKYYENESDIEGKLDASDKEAGYNIDEKTGVVRNDEENIILADSDFIFTYIMSDNYVYTLKNDNIATIDKADAWYEKIGKAIITGWYKVRNFFAGPLLDVLGITDAVVDGWGKGLIVLYYDNGLGQKGSVVNDDSLWNWDSVEINPERKTLSIKRVEFLNNNNAMEFSLDGWTGRYGMPLEFLLAIHKATMMPDLAFDMATSFNTNVNVYLHDISDGEVTAAYKTPSGKYVTYEDINNAKTGLSGRNWLSAVIAWFDNLYESDEETIAMKELGVDVANGEGECSCTIEKVYYDSTEEYILKKENDKYYYQEKVTTDDDETKIEIGDQYTGVVNEVETVTSVCENCRKKSKAITDILGPNNDYHFLAYDIYIANVSNHWYRDVYFVLNDDTVNGEDLKFVTYDYEYEAQMKERWTLYETYTDDPADEGTYKYNPSKAGDFIVFMIDENGDYMKDESGNYVLYDGTFEEARAAVLYTKDEDGNYIEYAGTYKESSGITLYEKTSEGKYVVYNGDSQVAVAKKAITIDSSDTNELEDLNWKKNSEGIWTAYEENTNPSSTSWEPLFTKDKIEATENEIEKYVKSHSYVKVTTTGNIVQTGEGQRAETNSEIKRMFLQNQYFRYDGSDETAEIITALRKNNDIEYGPLSESDLKKTVEIDGTTYTADDYSGKVLLNQDSLNAFSILENTHTLDSDYIYRDFKELIVELGYFEKEELTDETPRLLEFLIPEIGSAGYPDRTIDKRENEFGTMIHSKHDIDANEKYTLQAIVENATNAGAAAEQPEQTAYKEKNTNVETTTLAVVSRVNNDRLQLNSKEFNTTEVGDISGGTKRPEQIPLKEFIETTEEMCQFIDEKGYNYCVMRKPPQCPTCSQECKEGWTTNWKCIKHTGACPCTEVHCDHAVYHRDACGLSSSFKASQENPTSRYDTCCNYLVSWALQNVGLLEEGQTLAISTMYTWALEDMGGTEIENGQPLEPGDILFYDDFGHVDLVAEKNGSGYLKFNGGHYIETGAQRGDSKSSVNEFGGWSASRPPEHVVRLPWGKQKDEPYTGYLGNEAVVSPVTGILLEYGTYDKEDEKYIDSVTNEPYRVNVDLKYGPANYSESYDEEDPPEEDKFESRIVSDEVGYAKILVIDKEYYEKLESNLSSKISYSESKDLLSSNGVFKEVITTEEQLDALTDKNTGNFLYETMYGYKEFAETYEKYGIAGYVVYIDGFKCELPDTTFVDTDDDGDLSDESGVPNGTPLTMDSFKVSYNKINDDNKNIQSLYEAAEEYKLASNKATEKLNVEETIKCDTAPAITVDNIIYIKEGTVLGRTYTDKELVEERLANGENPKYNYEYYSPEENPDDDKKENMDKIIGNYIRIIMRNLDDTVVEDVENYMKLDENEQKGDQEYQFREGDLELLADAICHEGCGNYCAKYLNTTSDADKLYLSISTGYTIINKLNTDSGFVPDYNDPSKLWDSSKSPLYNLLCRIPKRDVEKATAYGYTTGVGGGWYGIAFGLRQRVDKDELSYCDICFEAAEYIQENDSMNHKNNGDFGSEYSAGEGMPHTLWQQGGNYQGKGKLWLFLDKNKNGEKDPGEVDYYLFDTAN